MLSTHPLHIEALQHQWHHLNELGGGRAGSILQVREVRSRHRHTDEEPLEQHGAGWIPVRQCASLSTTRSLAHTSHYTRSSLSISPDFGMLSYSFLTGSYFWR